jgi:hypothetical protein
VEATGDLSKTAAEAEERILGEFERTGRILIDDPGGLIGGPGEEQFGDDILGELLPEPEPQGGADATDVEIPDRRIEVDLATPEALGAAVFRAMVQRDLALFDRVLIDAEGLQALAKIQSSTAEARAASLRKAAHQRYRLFEPKLASEVPEDGLASRVVYVRTRIGKGTTIWGKSPRRGEEVVQYWNNAAVFRLIRKGEATKMIIPTSESDDGTAGPYFEIDLGRILRTPKGEWRLASVPTVSGAFHVFLQAGLHLKEEMLHPEHHELPMSVGDFWRYRVLRSAGGEDDDIIDVSPEEVRFQVTEVKKYSGYRIVTLRRTHSTDKRSTSTQHLLVTPRRVYQCTRYCKYKGGDVGYVLDYIRINTPLFNFPSLPGNAWRNGGHKPTATSPAKYRIRDDLEPISVPAGEFAKTRVVEGNRQVRWLKPGVGIVKRQTRTDNGIRTQELIEYRVRTTE